jgi:hypothetical protein
MALYKIVQIAKFFFAWVWKLSNHMLVVLVTLQNTYKRAEFRSF